MKDSSLCYDVGLHLESVVGKVRAKTGAFGFQSKKYLSTSKLETKFYTFI